VASWKRTARFSRVGSALIISAVLFLAPALELFAAQTPPSESDAILNHLNRAISWYRLVIGLDVTAGQPSDTLYLENARNSATQALQYAFQAALAEAALLQASDKSKGTDTAANNQAGDQQQGIANALSDIDNRIQQAQSKLQDLDQQLDKSKGKDREQLLSQRDTLQGELDLDKTIQESLQKISTVATGAQTATTGITAQVEQLKQSIPEVFANTSKKQVSASSGQNSKATNAQNSGLLGLLSILFSQMRDVHDIDDVISQTTALSATADKLDAPLRAQLKNLVQQGRSFLNQPPATDPKQVAAMRAQFQSLTGQFKQIADAAVPLRQEIILLDDTKGELVQWRDSIEAEYARVLRDLLTRVVGIFIALAFVLLLSELWRRATRRYIRDARRRRQLTIIRRVVVGFLMFLVVAAGFASEFSSLATFAGFLTAGIAVALQTVILSVAAYFFLIGRYGVRVGDRISVSGVTGDVIEIGLIRLYLMELSGTGIDLYPTGRVVVFSNSVMFQTAPFFKQLPGTAYAWHELAVTLASNTDLALVEKKLMDAVNSVFSQYRHNIDRQHALVERILDTPIAAPAPVGKVQFSDTGLEFVVRYPVEIQHAADIDDQVTRKLLEVIEGDPQLKGAVSASPRLRAAIKA
jgi:small-conductance mechanosensitive channel